MDARAVPGSSSFLIFRLPLPPLFFSLLCPESRSVKKNVLPSECILREMKQEKESVCGVVTTIQWFWGGGNEEKKGGWKKKGQRNEKKT
jgi:hypothetical protein